MEKHVVAAILMLSSGIVTHMRSDCER